MLNAHIRFDLATFDRDMVDLARNKMPSIIRNALNDTVKEVRPLVQKEMDVVFDRPTPYAKRGVVYDRATKENLVAAIVITGDRTKGGLPATAFLGPQIEGGLRSHKAFERQLIQRGHMQKSEVAVPAARTKLDRYGNMTQGFLNRVMADLQIEYRGAGATRVRTEASLKRNKNYQKARFFVPKRTSNLAPGVWQHDPRDDSAFPVILFLRSKPYKIRFPLKSIVERHARARLVPNFDANFSKLVKSRS